MSPEISVVICSLDRVDHVRQAVKSLACQTVSASRFEVLVVDNGASGSLAVELAAEVAEMTNLRVVHEAVMGLSQARNRGTSEADGDIVLFMDDDALAEPGLVGGHLRRHQAPDAPVATGGRIYLRWPGSPPSWMSETLESYYSGLDLGDAQRRLVFPEYPYGANMAIRRDVLIDVGGFDLGLGRRGRNLISGEEKDLFLRLSRRGDQVDYVPDAVVHHCVLPERAHRHWLLRRSWAQGRSDVAMGLAASGHTRGSMPHLLARSALHAWRAVTHALELLGATVARRDDARKMRCASLTLRWLGAAYEGLAAVQSRDGSVAH